MGLWDKLKGELVDIVEWLDPTSDTLVYRFERYNNEIKYGAKLIVREGQAAVFVSEGRLADVFAPGTYTLETRSLPVLSTLMGWKHGFESPFKSEVYFVSTRQFTDLKWGTKNPVMLRDPEFGPLRLRAFGTYVVRVTDPAAFLREIVGTSAEFTMDQISEQLRNQIVARFTDILGESRIPVLDLCANYDELGKFVTERMRQQDGSLGIDVTKLLVENISLPPEVEQALDKRTSMGVIGDLSRYTQFQSAEALRDAAKNPGGMAAVGIGAGMGMAMGGQMAQAMSPAGGMPPPIPGPAGFFVALGGQQSGPFDLSTLQKKAQAGELSRETLVWRNGLPSWTKAGEISELGAIFASTPPPLPPQ